MSTVRRSTRRATSKASSGNAPSSIISDYDIPPTPSTAARRSARKAAPNSTLPAVGLRTSTAYGTNSTTQPTFMKGPEANAQISDILGGLLEPVREEATPSNAGCKYRS
jgi:hypothetical protein